LLNRLPIDTYVPSTDFATARVRSLRVAVLPFVIFLIAVAIPFVLFFIWLVSKEEIGGY
jgi:hypothetical protein